MSKFKARAATVAVAALAMLGSMTAVAGAATDGPSSLGTPGIYAWPASTPNYTVLQFYTKVTQDPTPGVDNGANVFWSHQFSSTTDANGAGGYIGFQTPKDAKGGRQVLFSVWGATGCQLGDSRYEPVCVNNTDGDPGAGARIFYPWVAGVKYRLSIQQASAKPGWWAAYIYDPTKNQNIRIGYLQFGGTSWGQITPEVDWVEYYNWNDPNAVCGDQLNSGAVFYPITGTNNGKKVAAVPYSSTSHSDTCTYADQSSIATGGSANIVATPQSGTAAPPTANSLTTATPSITNGSSITFNYATPVSSASSSNWIGVYKQGDTPGTQYSTDWQTASGDRGSVTFTANYGPGTYQVYYFYNDGYSVLAGPVTVTVK